MTISDVQATRLNNSMSAAQDVALGTLAQTMQTNLDNVTGASAFVSVIEETAAFGDFTDGGGAAGTFEFSTDIPAGATFLYSAVTSVTGFAGDTSCTLVIGDGSDSDRYMTGTPSIFATAANGVSVGAPSGTVYHTAAKTPTLTATSATDWGSVTAGSVTVKLYFLT